MDTRGLPLLSGPPPPLNDARVEACRKCNKDFNIVFTRSRQCNHCGYSYCNSCSDYQALMPRSGDDGAGYVVMPVCAFCIDFLTVTAAGRAFLKSLPLSKLRKYVDAYNIKVDRAVEKDDLIDGILAAKGLNGCLSPANEEYYRKYSVPNRVGTRPRGIFSRSGQDPHRGSQPPPPPPPNSRPVYNFPRPDLVPDRPPPLPQRRPNDPSPPPPPVPPPPVPPRPRDSYIPETRSSPPPPPPPPRPGRQHFPPTSPPPSTPPHSHSGQAPPPPSPFTTQESHQPRASSYSSTYTSYTSTYSNVPASDNATRPRTTSATVPTTTPTLDDLLSMSAQSVASLSVSTLKSILFANHVNAGMILEKGELVVKVQNLVEEERRNRERQSMVEEIEELERLELEREAMEESERARGERESGNSNTSSPSAAPKPRPVVEREGLCVVCYDNDANIAIVDCGHLAMCRECSDLIMAGSRECPLCRTRIVTEARLLRIFKT